MESQSAKEKSKIDKSFNSVFVSSPLISTSPTLVAWSSYKNNMISVIDLKTKQKYLTFDGAMINDASKYQIL